jgi:prepilin-type N-terminal cleavage/methylation domain-containing protein
MQSKLATHNQDGFSIIELVVALSVMLVLTASVFSLMGSSMKISTATYELTEAQENLRIAQEFINRDLMNAGDGLKGISTIRVPETFVRDYLTLTPIIDAADNMPAGIVNFGILTSDNNVPGGTTVIGAVPAATVRTGSDRQTILQIDPQFIAITPTSINAGGTVVTLPCGTPLTGFTVGEIYFISSSLGGTFATLTARNNTTCRLTFANGAGADVYGFNLAGANHNIQVISSSGTLPTSLQRMMIIHYYVNSDGLLMRRVFGVKGMGFRDSIITEHVMNVQFNYSLEVTDANGNVVPPTAMLANRAERLGVRQVEVTVTVETPHTISTSAGAPQFSMTTGTSVRNMQFRRAQQPTSGN